MKKKDLLKLLKLLKNINFELSLHIGNSNCHCWCDDTKQLHKKIEEAIEEICSSLIL